MKILFLNENPLPVKYTKGTVAAKELRLRAAIEEVEEIHVIARRGVSMVKPGVLNSRQGPLEKKITIHLLPPWPYYFSFIPLFIYGLVLTRKYKPDLIEAESPLFSGPAAVLLGKIYRVATIVEIRSTFHDLAKLRFKYIPQYCKQLCIDSIYWPTLRSATHCIANSKYYQKFLNEKKIVSTIINPGVQYPPNSPIQKTASPIRIGYIGRLVPEKNVELLLKAFAQVIKSKKINIELEIAGTGPSLAGLKRLAKELRISKYCKFLGFQDNYYCLKRWHIAVNPISVTTPLEMVNAEAAYMGVPIIVFGQDDFPETVENNISGLKIWPIDQVTLTNALINVIENEKLRTRLSQSGRKFAQEKYNFEKQVKTLRDLYQQLKLL